VRKLLRMVRRSAQSARQGWQVVQVPSVEAEVQRHLHRDLATLKQERASPTTCLQGWRRSQGIRLTSLHTWSEPRAAQRLWAGAPLPPTLHRRVLRGYAQHTLSSAQSAAVEAARRAQLQISSEASIDPLRQLMQLKGFGLNRGSCW
jgi:transposase